MKQNERNPRKTRTAEVARRTHQSAADSEPMAYRRKRAAAILGVSGALLRNWELEGRGPKFVRCGRAVLYPAKSLAEWLESHATDPEAA